MKHKTVLTLLLLISISNVIQPYNIPSTSTRKSLTKILLADRPGHRTTWSLKERVFSYLTDSQFSILSIQKQRCTTGKRCHGTGSLCLEMVVDNRINSWCYCDGLSYGKQCTKQIPRDKSENRQWKNYRNRLNVPVDVRDLLRSYKAALFKRRNSGKK